MNKIALIAQLVCILFGTHFFYSQSLTNHFKIPDSLKSYSFEELDELFSYNYEDTLRSRVYLKSMLEKGRINMDSIEMARAYSLLFYYENEEELRLSYLETSIRLTEKLGHNRYPASSYSIKGGFYLGKWDYEQSLDNYLMALEFAKRNKNQDFQYVTQHNIGIIKSKLGKHQEALNIFKECLDYEERKGIVDTLDYLDIMVDLTESYAKNNMIDSSNYYLNKVIPISLRHDSDLYSKFVFVQGVNLYTEEKYSISEKTIMKVLPHLVQLEDKREMVNAYFYLGKINESLSKNKNAIHYYKKVDSVFKQTRFITPEVREGYSFLINYYKDKQDFQNQLMYVERLLKFDSILHQNKALVNEKLIKKYDTAELLAEKEKLIEFVHSKNSNFKIFIWVLVCIILFLSILFYYQYRKRKLYSERFKKFIESDNQVKEIQVDKVIKKDAIKLQKKRDLKISEEIKEDILFKIEKFEKNRGYLEPNITTNSLAIRFKTNRKYISRIVNIYKEKNFTNYINDLRVEYLIQELKTNKKFRNYTIKAISGEIGFNTTEAFSKYFHKKTGLYPSYFIKKMEEYSE
ncbi:AraC family transcriptional regulator [Aquimarina sp. AU474]|uniref:AraC family transcriptional regulator n=1 Tax=Aquimarina sp. AU474 TaxID=2108529 RepID=UPI000D69829F|nr:AraC family transcriptional regulator [Aquimarina sp. AU474]